MIGKSRNESVKNEQLSQHPSTQKKKKKLWQKHLVQTDSWLDAFQRTRHLVQAYEKFDYVQIRLVSEKFFLKIASDMRDFG